MRKQVWTNLKSIKHHHDARKEGLLSSSEKTVSQSEARTM